MASSTSILADRLHEYPQQDVIDGGTTSLLDACLNDLASKWFEFIMIEVIEVLKEERSQNICTLVVRISANFRLL